MSDAYRDLLEAKAVSAPLAGFDVSAEALNPWLKPHVRAVAQWGLAGGRRAFFLAYGLHKTSLQIEVCSQVLAREGGEGLIVAPLGVRQEFFDDAATMGVDIRFIRSDAEIVPGALHLTNYDSVLDGKITPARFKVASLDEADCLRSYGSKTFQDFMPAFEPVPYRFVATATPSPNRYKEIIHYAGWLGIMDTGQALTRWFQRNSEKANDLTLYPHKEEEFWLWVNSWAIFLQKPSDLGFSDEGYVLPEIEVRWHEVASDIGDAGVESNGQGRLLRDAAVGIVEAAQEKRVSIPARIAKLKALREAEPENNFILWHDLEDERRAIEQAIPAARSVYGAQLLDDREDIVRDFKEGRLSDLAAKPVMLGAGGNLQRHCHRAIFSGIGYKYRDFAQAIHRIQRFGQAFRVVIDIIYTEAEREIRREFEAKWARDIELRVRMSQLIRRYGLSQTVAAEMAGRAIGVERQVAEGAGWTAINNDSVVETRTMASDSVGLIVTSIPFGTQYEYCASYNDFGHNDDTPAFWRQMDHLTPNLLRILQPGRLMCVHVKDRILFGNVTGLGFPTVEAFHAQAIAHYQRHGFAYLGFRFVQTDVVRENNQTYRLGYSEMCKDASRMGAGSPELVLMFRKMQSDRSRGYADDRVTKLPAEYSLARWQIDADAFWRSNGNRFLTAAELAALPPKVLAKTFNGQGARLVYNHEDHVALGDALAARKALPTTFTALNPGSWSEDVWADVNRMRTLNTDQASKGREKHVCPLQFDIVDRLIRLYSNKGDLVFDPFGGLMTVPVRALKLGRRGMGVELHDLYWSDGVRFLRATEAEVSIPALFDLDDPETELRDGAAVLADLLRALSGMDPGRLLKAARDFGVGSMRGALHGLRSMLDRATANDDEADAA